MTPLLSGIFLFRVGAVYEPRLASYGLETVVYSLHGRSASIRVLGRRLLELLFNYSGRGTYAQATPGLQNA